MELEKIATLLIGEMKKDCEAYFAAVKEGDSIEIRKCITECCLSAKVLDAFGYSFTK